MFLFDLRAELRISLCCRGLTGKRERGSGYRTTTAVNSKRLNGCCPVRGAKVALPGTRFAALVRVVYQQMQRWLRAECFELLGEDVRSLLREWGGRKNQPTAVVIDSRGLQSRSESGARAGYNGASGVRDRC
ncbi:MAG: transposase domain protein [Edaphobacter sp.]|nr:transposase domain protein [Edaphobacter sp.]